jgi:hypothetical protein
VGYWGLRLICDDFDGLILVLEGGDALGESIERKKIKVAGWSGCAWRASMTGW